MKTKSFLLIGMGTFGHHLCRNLAQIKNCELMIADRHSENLEDLLPLVVSAKVGDCTDEKVLASFDVPSFDTCFVCIGSSFQASLQITSLLHELGAKKVIAKAEEDVQAKFLLRNGADQIVYPERDIAQRIAVSESSSSIYDFIGLSDGYGIYEIKPMQKWIGKSIRELNLRAAYNVNILAVKKDGHLFPIPSPDHVFDGEEHLMVISNQQDIGKIAR